MINFYQLVNDVTSHVCSKFCAGSKYFKKHFNMVVEHERILVTLIFLTVLNHSQNLLRVDDW